MKIMRSAGFDIFSGVLITFQPPINASLCKNDFIVYLAKRFYKSLSLDDGFIRVDNKIAIVHPFPLPLPGVLDYILHLICANFRCLDIVA